MAGEYGTDTNDQYSNTFLPTFISIHVCFLNFIFNWRKIALQCCIDFWRLRYRDGPCGHSVRRMGQLEKVVSTCTQCAALCLVAQSCPSICHPCGLQPTRLLCPWGFSRQEYWRGVPYPSPEDLLNQRLKPRSPSLQVDSLLTEPPGKPKNTGVGSLSLFQGIFPIQELNQSLLHCRCILYQLSYQGSPYV